MPEYKRRKYDDGSVVVYTSAKGQICTTTEEYSKLIVDALNTDQSYTREIETGLENAEKEIADLEKELLSVRKECGQQAEQIIQLEEELETARPKTLIGEQKEEILQRLRRLDLSVLEEIDVIYSAHILGFERIDD